MNGRILFRVALAVLVLAGLAAVGVVAYNAGVARGLAEGAALAPAAEGGAAVLPYAYGPPYFYRPFFGWGLGPLGCLFPLLFVLLFFALFKGLVWRGPWGWGRGWRGYGPGAQGVPPPFEEWRRRAHEGADKPAGQ